MVKTFPDMSFEKAAQARGYRLIAGVDEVGRGPLAGPVTAAAVILDPARVPEGLADSKQLSEKRRNATLVASMLGFTSLLWFGLELWPAGLGPLLLIAAVVVLWVGSRRAGR